jgi:hypothetical protein
VPTVADFPGSTSTGYIDDTLGLDGYGSVLDYLLEQIVELQHPLSVKTFAKMRHEPQLAAVLKTYIEPITHAQWAVDNAGCRDEVAQRVADNLGLPIKGDDEPPATGARRRKFTWGEFLRTVLTLRQTYGHAFTEQAWDVTSGGYEIASIQERMPQTIAGLRLNPDGTLKAVVQGAMIGQKDAPQITTADHRLVYFTRERQGSNYYGESLLRPSYGPWLIKDQMIRVHATSIRKFGMGTPVAQAVPGTSPQPQQIAEAQRVVSQLHASANAGTAMPAGFELKLVGMQGSVPDALAFITYLDRLMTRSTLTSILDMAAAEKGNRSLGETVMDLMILAQQGEANQVADDATRQIVVPFVDANYGEDEAAPRVVCGSVGADVETTAQDIYWLMAYGGLRPDAPARAWIRQLRGMPAEDLTDPVHALPAANPAQPDPNAPPTPGGE